MLMGSVIPIYREVGNTTIDDGLWGGLSVRARLQSFQVLCLNWENWGVKVHFHPLKFDIKLKLKS